MCSKLLEKIFSAKNEYAHKVFTIMGVKLKFRRKDFILKQLEEKIENLNIKADSIINYENNLCWLDSRKDWWKKENFDFFADFENLEKKYKILIKNLDKESIELVEKIISRLQAFVIDGREYFTLSEQEKKERKIFKRFTDEKIRLNNGNFSKKGYIFPQEAMEISVLEYRHGLDCIEYPENFKNKDIIDVGGYIGDSALVFSELTNKKVHTFEPVSNTYEILLRTIELNDKNNILANNFALGAENKTEKIKCDYLGAAIESVANQTPKDVPTETIRVKTLDEYVKENNLQVGLIKVDIEGYKQEFLKGAMETIKTQRPVLILSIYHSASDFFDIKPIIENLNLGYKFKIHKPFDYSIMTETVLICEAR